TESIDTNPGKQSTADYSLTTIASRRYTSSSFSLVQRQNPVLSRRITTVCRLTRIPPPPNDARDLSLQ
ncbi:MAG TPA: hypothetical protein VFD75_04505, partial [Pyrinomonadaceae bacterium]|nr:hypothetical protein [Pyrinomonadaceae bacterium]